MGRLIAGATVACVLTSLTRAAEPAATPLALVIGNATYSSLPPLPACSGSARIVSTALQHAGFDVTEGADLTNGEMGAAIGRFTAKLNALPPRNGILYICGYAVDLEGRDFLLPASARLERETDALSQGLAARSVLGAIDRSSTPVGLVLLDAVSLSKNGADLHMGALAQLPRRNVSFAAASTAAPLPEGPSPFAGAVSAALGSPPIEVGAMLQAMSTRLGGTPDTLAIGAPSDPAWLIAAPPVAAAAPATVPASGAAATSAAAPQEEQLTAADRRRLQVALSQMGYYTGKIDGRFGAEMRTAIRRYQQQIGADAVGRLTPDQTARLIAYVGSR